MREHKTGRIKRKQNEKGVKGEEIYANDLEQDYKMASLIPVTVLNFARFLLSSFFLSFSLYLSFFLLLSFLPSPPFFFFLHLLLLLLLLLLSLLTAVPRCLPNRREAVTRAQRNSLRIILEFFCATISMNTAAETHR